METYYLGIDSSKGYADFSVRQGRCCMKSFDAVKTMHDTRARLSERYQKDAKRQIDDLRRIREKYNIHPYPLTVKQPKVAKNEAKYGSTDS